MGKATEPGEVIRNKTTDFMYITGNCGLELFKLEGHICHTVFNDNNYQIFYSEHCNAIYDKKEEKVYKLEINAWTNLVLKLEYIIKYPK